VRVRRGPSGATGRCVVAHGLTQRAHRPVEPYPGLLCTSLSYEQGLLACGLCRPESPESIEQRASLVATSQNGCRPTQKAMVIEYAGREDCGLARWPTSLGGVVHHAGDARGPVEPNEWAAPCRAMPQAPLAPWQPLRRLCAPPLYRHAASPGCPVVATRSRDHAHSGRLPSLIARGPW